MCVSACVMDTMKQIRTALFWMPWCGPSFFAFNESNKCKTCKQCVVVVVVLIYEVNVCVCDCM